MVRRSAREQRSGHGRHRGVFHNEEDLLREMKAKGHENGTERRMREEPEISDVDTERGHQKGYGKNQDKEGKSRHTRRGTRAPGSEHG